MCELFNEAVKPLLEKERIESEIRGEKVGRILERIEMGRELQVPEEVLVEQLMKKFEFTRETVMEYMCT